MLDLNLVDAETLAEWRKDAAAQVDEAIATAQKEAPPEGDKEDWCAISTRELVDSARMSITYLEAIREAQAKLLRDDERVFIYGQDVGGRLAAPLRRPRISRKNFPDACLNTPISEDAMVGTAIGAAMQGMRPIVEMQFADFSSIAFNQIVNNAGTHYWRTNVPVPSRCGCLPAEHRAAGRFTAKRWNRFMRITRD